MNVIKIIAFCFYAGVLLSACTSVPQGVTRTPLLVSLPDTVTKQRAEYVLSVGDEIEIRFAGRTDMTQTFRVQPDGLISPPYLSPLPAAGKSLSQLTADLKQILAELVSVNQRPLYILAVGDELDVRFINNADMNQVVRIRPDGRITLPYVRSVLAEGKTPEDFESELKRVYSQYLKRPDLMVAVRSFSSNLVRIGDRNVPAGLANNEPVLYLKTFATPQVFVGGEVERPGVMIYRNNMTLLQAIIEAGGNKPSGELRSVIVLRKSADSALVIRRDLLSDLADGTTNDIPLEPSDVVVIPKTGIATISEVIDQYLYKPFAFLRNSSFSLFYNLTPDTTINAK